MRKTLTLDIETSPHLCYTFQTWGTNIMPIQVIEPTRMISVSAKWEHERKVQFFSEYHFIPDSIEDPHESRKRMHREMVLAIHALMDEADVVVTYNGDKFDLLHLGREFDLAGLKDPSPFVSVDLYKVIKGRELWMSHKLAYISERKGLSGKMDNSGWKLWLGVLSSDPVVRHKAWLEMRKYNKQDVVVTEEVFHEELPNIKNLPHMSLFEEGDAVPQELRCKNCGSPNVQRRGYSRTPTRKYHRIHCQDCGRWGRDTRSIGGTGTT